jgi:RNA polymerase sigma factor (sigma-70 family)
MKDLLMEYKESLRKIRVLKAKHPQRKVNRSPEEDIRYGYLSNMETSLNFVIQWLSTGRQPGNIRGVERMDAYRREVLCDPLWFQEESCDYRLPVKSEGSLPDPRRYKKVEEALSILTDREKEVFKMSRGEGFSFQEIAELLGISRGAVGALIHRAEKRLTGQFQRETL